MEWNQPYPVMLLKPIELPDFVLVNFSVMAIEQVFNTLNTMTSNFLAKICFINKIQKN